MYAHVGPECVGLSGLDSVGSAGTDWGLVNQTFQTFVTVVTRFTHSHCQTSNRAQSFDSAPSQKTDLLSEQLADLTSSQIISPFQDVVLLAYKLLHHCAGHFVYNRLALLYLY